MEKELIFSGMTAAPYDDQSPDGQCALLSNVEVHNNAIRRTQFNKTEYDVKGYDLVYIHEVSNNKTIFILHGEGKYMWMERGQSESHDIYTTQDIATIQSVNNTLVFIWPDSPISYALWNGETYKYLGELPELNIRFGLMLYANDKYWQQYSVSVNSRHAILGTDLNYALNEYRNYHSSSFVYPFYVRAALRLYDNSLIKHSSPVLMFPNSKGAPSFFINGNLDDVNEDTVKTINLYGFYANLTYTIDDDLSDWSDIINSVDIFVSEQMNNTTQYTQGEYILFTLKDKGECDNFSVGAIHTDTGSYNYEYLKRYIRDYTPSGGGLYTFTIPVTNDYDKLTNLYKLASCNTATYTSGKTIEIKPDENIVQNITQQEAMEDDYRSHDILIPSNSFVYNRRLSISNIRSLVYGSPSMRYLVPWATGASGLFYTYLKIVKDNNEYYINCGDSFCDVKNALDITRFIYVPEPRAKQIIFATYTNPAKAYVFDLSQHPFLYGSYYYRDSFGLPSLVDISEVIPVNVYDEYPNTIYTSEVSNPYTFPVEGVLTVGSGYIITLVALTKELSPSQFGQYPLVAMCSDGNYALKVQSNGLYTDPSKMKSYICANKESVVQLPGAVVYMSENGLMMMDGSDIICISSILEGPADKLVTEDGTIQEPFIDYAGNAKIAYDFFQNKLLVIKPDTGYMYVYSIDNLSWSVQTFSFVKNVINAYPYTYIQISLGKVYMIDKPYIYDDIAGLALKIITRPVKFDTFRLKRINSFSVEGMTQSGYFTVQILASNDLKTWFDMGTAKLTSNNMGRIRGRYFKFFRFVIKPLMTSNDHITGMRIDYDVRTDNRIR